MRSVRRRSFSFVLAAASLICLYLGSVPRLAAQGGEPRYFALRGVTVVPISGPKLENVTVIISRGIISAVAKDAAVPDEALVIDGSGLTVYPGLIDSFTDVGIPPAAADAAARQLRPSSRGPEDRPGASPWRTAANEADLSDKRIESWRSAGFTTVVSAPKGGMFPGQAAVLDLQGERNGDLVVKTPVAVPVSLQPVGNFNSFPGSLMGSIPYVRQVWLDTDWWSNAEALYEKTPRGVIRPRYDRTDAALAQALSEHALVLIPANSTREIRRSFDLVQHWRFKAVLYGGQMSYEVADEIAAKKLPVLVNLKWPEAEKDADPDEVPSLNTLRFRDRAPSSPGALAKAGVKFAFYSDTISAPKDILKAVKKSIDAGLAPDAALRALTLWSAEIFGVADQLGSIDKGKIANLVVTDGDLFNEKTKIKFVFVDGRRFEIREPEKPKEPPKGDLTGKWKLSYTTPEGEDESTADLTMDSDGTLSGSITSNRGTANIVSGALTVDKFTFTVNISLEDTPTDVVFTGTFDGTAIKGSISVMGYNIEFTGTRPDAKPQAELQFVNETGAAR
jgi:imidazolonepropionase-like amidohydrolase